MRLVADWRARQRQRGADARLPRPGHVAATAALAVRQRREVGRAMGDSSLLAALASGDALSPGLGAGCDERVVEYAWLLAQQPAGRVLDAGSTLNHPHVLKRFLPRFDGLTIATLAPERRAFTRRGVAYVYADLRDLPFRDGWFDAVVCASTLEHVGLDNAHYGAAGPASDDPATQARSALAELRRVLRPSGTLLLTVPYGRPENFGWLRCFGERDVAAVLDWWGADESAVSVFALTPAGWERSSLDASRDARYHDPISNPQRGSDGAVAARAVACLSLCRRGQV